MPRKKSLAIVIPAANEEETIKHFLRSLLQVTEKLPFTTEIFIILDNVSKDNTREILEQMEKKESKLHVIFEPKNRSVVDAYVRGFKEAIKKNFDYIVEMDCGFSHLPKDLHKITAELLTGYDCVFGMRPLSSPSYNVPFLRRIYSLGGTVLSNVLLGMRYKDTTSGFNGYRTEILKKLIKKPLASTGHFWHTEMRFRAKKYNFIEVTITYSFPSKSVRLKTLINSFQTLFMLSLSRLGISKHD